jgi:type VI secretion system protein VasD
MRTFRFGHRLLAVLAVALLAACIHKQPVEAPVSFTLHVQATSDINPDSNGRASPVVVRVYQLRSGNAFQAAEFFAIYDHDKQTLAADLMASNEYVLKPGEALDLVLKAEKDTHTIGVLAAFRDLRNSQWHSSYDWVQPGKKPPRPASDLQLLVSRDSVTIGPGGKAH